MGPFLLHCQPTAQLSQDASTRHLHVGSSRVEPPCQPLWCIHSGAASQAGGSFGAVQDGVCDPVGYRVPGEGGGGVHHGVREAVPHQDPAAVPAHHKAGVPPGVRAAVRHRLQQRLCAEVQDRVRAIHRDRVHHRVQGGLPVRVQGGDQDPRQAGGLPRLQGCAGAEVPLCSPAGLCECGRPSVHLTQCQDVSKEACHTEHKKYPLRISRKEAKKVCDTTGGKAAASPTSLPTPPAPSHKIPPSSNPLPPSSLPSNSRVELPIFTAPKPVPSSPVLSSSEQGSSEQGSSEQGSPPPPTTLDAILAARKANTPSEFPNLSEK